MNDLPYETDTDAWYFKDEPPPNILYLRHDLSYLYAMNMSMRGKIMSRMRHIYRIFCMRCGKYQANIVDPCVCLPMWLCMDNFRTEMCREQQCIYCDDEVISEFRPRRYPRIFNVKRKHITLTSRNLRQMRDDSVYSPRSTD